MGILKKLVNYFAMEPETDFKMQAVFLVSQNVIRDFKYLEGKISCYNHDEHDEKDLERKVKLIVPEHMENLLVRRLNFIDDAPTTFDVGSELIVNERNERLAYFLNLYLERFREEIKNMPEEKRVVFLHNVKKAQIPAILAEEVNKFEKSLFI